MNVDRYAMGCEARDSFEFFSVESMPEASFPMLVPVAAVRSCVP